MATNTHDTDPFSWAKAYERSQTAQGMQNSQQGQNALLQVFQEEAARQRPYAEMPTKMAELQARGDIQRELMGERMSYAQANADAKAQAKIANMPTNKITQLIDQESLAAGLDPDIMKTIGFLESRFDPNAKNRSSSAGGVFQIIDDTARGLGVGNKFDPVQNIKGGVRLGVQNKQMLERAGLPVNAGTMYMMHQQGPKALKAMRAAQTNPNASAEAILGSDQVRLNGGRPGMSIGAFVQMWQSKANNLYASNVKNKKEYRARYRGGDQQTGEQKLAALLAARGHNGTVEQAQRYATDPQYQAQVDAQEDDDITDAD